MQISSGNLRTLYTAFSAAFQQGFAPVTPQWNRIAQLVPSTTRENEYGWLETLAGMREWVGSRVINNIKVNDYRLRNVDYEQTYGVSVNDVADGAIAGWSTFFQNLGYETASFPDELVFGVAKAGFTSLCYDGQFFFDTDHPVQGPDDTIVSVSNSGGGSGAQWMLLDTMKPVKPFIYQLRKPFELVRKDRPEDDNVFDSNELLYGVHGRMTAGYGRWQLAYGSKQTLNATNYAAARAAMMSYTATSGRPLNIMPNLLVVGPTLEAAARQILNAENDAAGATNVWRNSAELLVTPWLA